MSYTYHGTNGIIVLPGRSISTFPSGLVRVDRTYAVRADRASVVRREFAAGNLLPFDDGTPAIDGLYIFPDPQETRRDDGFVEFRVSGYGRTNTIGQTTSTIEDGEATLVSASIFPPTTASSISRIPVVIEVVTTKSVAFNTTPITEILPRAIPINVFVRQGGRFRKLEEVYKPGTVFTQSGGNLGRIATQTSIEIVPIIREAPGTQFGTFREVIFTFSAAVTVRTTSFPSN
jgi:hypothetical protein